MVRVLSKARRSWIDADKHGFASSQSKTWAQVSRGCRSKPSGATRHKTSATSDSRDGLDRSQRLTCHLQAPATGSRSTRWQWHKNFSLGEGAEQRPHFFFHLGRVGESLANLLPQ